MNRRQLLKMLAGAMVMDPERLLWVPGKKMISIPAPLSLQWVRDTDAFNILAAVITNELQLDEARALAILPGCSHLKIGDSIFRREFSNLPSAFFPPLICGVVSDL